MALRLSRGSKGSRGGSDVNPFTQTGFVASAVLLALVAVFGVVMSVIFANQDTSTAQSVTPDPVGVNTGLPGQDAAGVGPIGGAVPSGGAGQSARQDAKTPCPQFPQTDDAAVGSTPPQITWTVFRTVLLPSSESLGPKVEHGGVARCFAHSATGALLAASQITTRYFLSSDWRSVVDLQVLPGQGRDTFRQRQADIESQFGMPDDPDPGQINQFAGYRFVTYTAETAVVQIARRSPQGKLMSAIHTLVWQNGDWRLQMQSDGSDASVRQEIGSLDGYQKWAGA
ncbi:MAG: hypothetical protein HOV66_29440 [Streptomycetaceae bacterium]|nr:hypothetical protein [Streptomycetaceae bacterium]NUS58947.1 hypothetical protein [Streptomycetaceae bacterium]